MSGFYKVMSGGRPVFREWTMKRQSRTQCIAAFALLAALVSLDEAGAAPPLLRAQVDQRGDFILIGNTLAHDCVMGVPSPVVGSVASCGTNVADSAPDIFWLSDAPVSATAEASTSIAPSQARSTAALSIPAGAVVTHAFLYWGAERSTSGFDDAVTIEPPNASGENVAALAGFSVKTTPETHHLYQSVADVTQIIKNHGSGTYSVSNVDVTIIENKDNSYVYAAWWLVVFYELATEPLRNLALFEGLSGVVDGQTPEANVGGFVAASAGIDAKLGVVAYEGDYAIDSDSLLVNAVPVSDAQNPSNNFFNGTQSRFGFPTSTPGDLPLLTGTAQSMSGIDIDIVDIAANLQPNASSLTVTAESVVDLVLLAGLVTSIVTVKDQCMSDADCAAPKPGCDTIATPHVCVECVSSAHCSGNTPTCDTVNQKCICVPMGNEVCNGLDDNCDGAIDEGDLGQGAPCSTELPGACGEGMTTCSMSGLTCVPLVPPGSQAEVCANAVDEDCDGALDNGCGAGGGGGAGAGGADDSSDEELIYYNGCVCELRSGTDARDLAWTVLIGAGIFASRRRRGQRHQGASAR